MIATCPAKIDCLPCNDFPIVNNSNEAPDQDRFLSRFAFLNAIPPIRQYPDFDDQGGGIFLQVGCMRWCWSTISQADADDCAARQAVECAFDPLIPGFPIPDPFHPNRISLFYNEAVDGHYVCPDGNVFTYTLPANELAGVSQGHVNRAAAGLANLRARQRHLCISNLDDPICVNTFFTRQITASGPNVAVFPATDLWELVNGTVPPGMTLETGFSSDGITFSGVPTTIGSYSFTVRCTIKTFGSNGFNDFMEKVFTVDVVGILNSDPLPAATLGFPYSEGLLAGGSTDTTREIWSVTSGSLPPGLMLSPDGFLSGTPTGPEAGYSFIVQVQFPVGTKTAVCSKPLTITTMNPIDWGNITPDIFSPTQSAWNGGLALPAGTYRIMYDSGAMEYAPCFPTQCWSVNTIGAGFRLFYDGGLSDVSFPASENTFPNQAGAEAENTGKHLDVTHIGGTMGMYLADTNYPDNVPGAPNPTFKLLQLS